MEIVWIETIMIRECCAFQLQSIRHPGKDWKVWVCVCVFQSVFPDKWGACCLFCLFFLSYMGNHNFILPFLLSFYWSLFCCALLGREFDDRDILTRKCLKAMSLVGATLCRKYIYIYTYRSLKSSDFAKAHPHFSSILVPGWGGSLGCCSFYFPVIGLLRMPV